MGGCHVVGLPSAWFAALSNVSRMGGIMREVLNGFCKVSALIALCGFAGCATVRHPISYESSRPEWTYDLAQLKESDLPDDFDREKYHLFLGVESTPSKTEEAARMGALLNAQQHVKIFLHSRGEMAIRHQISNTTREKTSFWAFRSQSEFLRFQSFLDDRADAQVAHVQAIRWYLEEHRPFWRIFWPFFNDTRPSRWRAWCVVAVPRAVCDRIIEDAIKRYGNEDTVSCRESARYPEENVSVSENTLGHRASRSAYLGVVNLLCSPLEIVNQPFRYAGRYSESSEVFRLAGFIQGIPVGIVMGVLRIVYGAGSLIAAPFGGSMIAIVRPQHPELVYPLARK